MSNKNTISYRRVGDFNIPNLIPPYEETAIRLGKCGILHKNYLQKHNPVLFYTLLIQGTLYQHCAEIDAQTQQMFDTLIKQIKTAEGVTEKLKEQEPWKWVQKMNNIQQRAQELVYLNLIYVNH